MFWLYRFIRRYGSPIAEPKARTWQRRLTFAYVLLAWNALGFVAFTCYKGKSDWAKYHGLDTGSNGSSAQQWAKTLGIKNAKVYTISGMTVTSSYEINDGGAAEENQQHSLNEQE